MEVAQETCCNTRDTNFALRQMTRILVSDETRQVSDVYDLHEKMAISGWKWHSIYYLKREISQENEDKALKVKELPDKIYLYVFQ